MSQSLGPPLRDMGFPHAYLLDAGESPPPSPFPPQDISMSQSLAPRLRDIGLLHASLVRPCSQWMRASSTLPAVGVPLPPFPPCRLFPPGSHAHVAPGSTRDRLVSHILGPTLWDLRFHDFKISSFQDFQDFKLARFQDFQYFKITRFSRFQHFQDFEISRFSFTMQNPPSFKLDFKIQG